MLVDQNNIIILFALINVISTSVLLQQLA